MRRHKAVQFGLLSEEKAVGAVNAAVPAVPAKVELLVDKRGNGLFDWFSGVAVVPKIKPSVKSAVRVESVKVEVAA